MPRCQPDLEKWENGFLMADELPETNLDEYYVTMKIIGVADQLVRKSPCPIGSSIDEVFKHTRGRKASQKEKVQDQNELSKQASFPQTSSLNVEPNDECHQEHCADRMLA